MKTVISLVLLVVALAATPVFSHGEPPKAVIEIGSGGSLKSGDSAEIKFNLFGSVSGAPLTGANIRVTPVGPAGAPPPFELGPGDQAGYYRGFMNLTSPGKWRLDFEIEHRGEIDRKTVEFTVMEPGVAGSPGQSSSPVRTERILGLAEHENPKGTLTGLGSRPWLWAGAVILLFAAGWAASRRSSKRGPRGDQK